MTPVGVSPNASRITNRCKCTRSSQSLTKMQSQAKCVRERVGVSQMCSMWARNGQKSHYTRAQLLFIASHTIPNIYVLEAHFLRTRGWSTPYIWTIRHTSNDYFSHLKHARAVRKRQDRTVRQPWPDGLRPDNLKHTSTDQVDLHGWTVRPPRPDVPWPRNQYCPGSNPEQSIVHSTKNI
jgi:hypothetical protein